MLSNDEGFSSWNSWEQEYILYAYELFRNHSSIFVGATYNISLLAVKIEGWEDPADFFEQCLGFNFLTDHDTIVKIKDSKRLRRF